jgi:hypothetical protein
MLTRSKEKWLRNKGTTSAQKGDEYEIELPKQRLQYAENFLQGQTSQSQRNSPPAWQRQRNDIRNLPALVDSSEANLYPVSIGPAGNQSEVEAELYSPDEATCNDTLNGLWNDLFCMVPFVSHGPSFYKCVK